MSPRTAHGAICGRTTQNASHGKPLYNEESCITLLQERRNHLDILRRRLSTCNAIYVITNARNKNLSISSQILNFPPGRAGGGGGGGYHRGVKRSCYEIETRRETQLYSTQPSQRLYIAPCPHEEVTRKDVRCHIPVTTVVSSNILDMLLPTNLNGTAQTSKTSHVCPNQTQGRRYQS